MRLPFALFAACTATAAGAQSFERVQQPPLTGYQLVLSDRSADRAVEQWVPRGQTLLRWRSMVTILRFDGLARTTDPRAYLVSVRRSVRSSCRDAYLGPLYNRLLATYPTSHTRYHCPLNGATNQPETVFVQAMAGFSDLFVVMVTFRRIRSREEFAWAERRMDEMLLCGPASREPQCDQQAQRRSQP